MLHLKFYIHLGEFCFQFLKKSQECIVFLNNKTSLCLTFIDDGQHKLSTWRMSPSSGRRREALGVSYREAVLCLEVFVHINANPVEIFHFHTGFNVPGKRGQHKHHEIRPFLSATGSVQHSAPTKRTFQRGSCWPYSPFLQPPENARRWTAACDSGQSVKGDRRTALGPAGDHGFYNTVDWTSTSSWHVSDELPLVLSTPGASGQVTQANSDTATN